MKLTPRDEEYIRELTGNGPSHNSLITEGEAVGSVPQDSLDKALEELGISRINYGMGLDEYYAIIASMAKERKIEGLTPKSV